MKKIFKLEDLDCANCAAKMERSIAKLDGVKSVSVNFVMQKLSLEADDAIFEDVLARALKAINRVEPDCRVII